MNEAPGGTRKEAKDHTVRYVLLGCGTLLLVVALGIFFLVKAVVGKAESLARDFTADQKREFAQPAGDAERAAIVVKRFDDFQGALRKGGALEPLVLDENEVNLLILHHPKWKPLSDKVRIRIEGETIGGEISVPLDEMAKVMPTLKGRYLNGSGTFSFGFVSGRLLVYLETLEVNGRTLPGAILSQLRSKNLMDEANADPEFQQEMERIESITVSGGKLTIVPKAPGPVP